MTPDKNLYIGMLSGTSRDGADLALLRFHKEWPQLLLTLCLPYPPELAALLKEMIESGRRPSDSALKEANEILGEFFGESVIRLLAKAGIEASDVAAIGSHGQTVWHDPDGPQRESIQLGDPRRIAEKTGIVTVADFRRGDIEAGGQGAPLAPLLHRALFEPKSGCRVVLNLGGIANISVLSSDGSVTGFDTGPANCLLDAWISEQRNKPFDYNGEWSSSGTVDQPILQDWLLDPYFQKQPPKSTGVEYFNLTWLRDRSRDRLEGMAPQDVQASLAQLTAVTVASAVSPFEPDDVLVCGGGAHNRDLLQRLSSLLPGSPVSPTDSLGLNVDSIEAVLFAWLARENLARRAQDTRSITGARQAVMLGEIFRPA
jgi:anhydro-N-acetylmuramic acid kinase